MFIKQLLINCETTLSFDFHNGTNNEQVFYLPIKKCNSCLCRKARFTQRAAVSTIQPFVRASPRILIEGARRNIEEKNPYSSKHL